MSRAASAFLEVLWLVMYCADWFDRAQTVQDPSSPSISWSSNRQAGQGHAAVRRFKSGAGFPYFDYRLISGIPRF